MGTISNTITAAVTLSRIGVYSSPLTITAAGAVQTDADAGIFGPATQAWTVVNAGVVSNSRTLGNGIELDAGGAVTNQAGGTVTAASAIVVKGSTGSIVNAGYIKGTAVGVQLTAGGTVVNQGGARIVLGGQGDSILLDQGGTVINLGSVTSPPRRRSTDAALPVSAQRHLLRILGRAREPEGRTNIQNPI